MISHRASRLSCGEFLVREQDPQAKRAIKEKKIKVPAGLPKVNPPSQHPGFNPSLWGSQAETQVSSQPPLLSFLFLLKERDEHSTNCEEMR